MLNVKLLIQFINVIVRTDNLLSHSRNRNTVNRTQCVRHGTTITTLSVTVMFQAVISLTLFGEQLSLLWWLGSCCILAGLILIHSGITQRVVTSIKRDLLHVYL